MKKLWVENITNGAVEYSENHTENGNTWDDKSGDAPSWLNYGKGVVDILTITRKMEALLILEANPNYPTIDFSGYFSMSNEKQLIMCEYFMAPYALRLSTTNWSEAKDFDAWDRYVDKTQGLSHHEETFLGRALVVENMRKHLSHKVRTESLSVAQAHQFYRDVHTFTDWYIRAACPDFYQWLTNEAGSIYALLGFEQTSYWSQELEDELKTIYNHEE